ncbi:hypothetical protein ACN28E_48330 [Archangium lansingense]|uniref:hypothetical protein n=1 Tax=Archangium lansingense TaxID=2995310 RepID=UPI003B8212C1
MSERPSAVPTRRQSAWHILAALVGVLLASLLALAWQFFRPLRLHDGKWVLAKVSPVHTGPDGRRLRALWYGADIVLRYEVDWDADGVYDCRADDCAWKDPAAQWAFCVSYRHEDQWVPAPQGVQDCESIPNRGAARPSVPASPAHDGKEEGGGM